METISTGSYRRNRHAPIGAKRARSAERSAAGAALGNTRAAFPVSNRGRRYALRDGVRQITTLERVRKCGVVPLGPTVTLRADCDGKRPGLGGITTCGSVWTCPVCAAKIAATRKTEVQAAIERAVAEGLHVSMLTLTMRHHKGQQLGDLWDALAYAWQGVTSGRRWVGDGDEARGGFRGDLGLRGYIRATEVTHGGNGWHVHVHILLISEKDPTKTPLFWQRKQGRRKQPYPLEVTMPKEFIAERWGRRLADRGVDFVAGSGGLHWETAENPEAIGRYVAKLQSGAESLSSEATLGQFKKARGQNRTPFQILADMLDPGDMDDVETWWAWESGSHGRRALTWSKGLRDWAGLGAEKSDEEIAEEEIGDNVIAVFTRESWAKVRAEGVADLLDTTERDGVHAAYRWLLDRGIDFSVPPDPGRLRE